MNLSQEISNIRKSSIPKERIQKRIEFEEKDRKAILASLDSLIHDSFDSVMSLMNIDLWDGKERTDRFHPLFPSLSET